MDVYVVNLNGTVIGASADFDSAVKIADRGEHQLNHHPWAEWRHESGTGKWWRNAMGLQVQTITQVPLAGVIEAGELSPVLAAQVRTEAMVQPVSYATEIGDWPIVQPIDETDDGQRYAVIRSEIEEIGRQFGAP